MYFNNPTTVLKPHCSLQISSVLLHRHIGPQGHACSQEDCGSCVIVPPIGPSLQGLCVGLWLLTEERFSLKHSSSLPGFTCSRLYVTNGIQQLLLGNSGKKVFPYCPCYYCTFVYYIMALFHVTWAQCIILYTVTISIELANEQAV